MRHVLWVSILLCSFSSYAEGTKELRPLEAHWGNVEINDQSRPFAKEGCDSLHRLYIHIYSTDEAIYFGFKPLSDNSGTYRLRDPDGNIVIARTNVPTSSGAGFIENYNQACAGPKIGGSPANGYNPLSYSPTKTGDYYIEFTVTDKSKTYHLDLFDITVVDANNTPIVGRLWSHAWDLSTRGGNNEMHAVFYIYTKDKYISAVNLNGIQPWGFVISSNSTGTHNTGNLFEDRKSVEGNHTYPEYKLFLNMPDPRIYDVAEPPKMEEDLRVDGNPVAEEEVTFFLNMDKSGTVEIFLDLDGVPGYQPHGKDVILVKHIQAGGDYILWDGKDGENNWVHDQVIVDVTSRFATGVTHLPLFDPEYHPNGYIVHRMLPDNSRAQLYWDDSNFSGGTVEFNGVDGDNNGHNFPSKSGGYGNDRSINTWWNGFENNNLKSFSFTMDGTILPISLSAWKATHLPHAVELTWTTESETNNILFTIERSYNGAAWHEIGSVPGAMQSTTKLHYNYIDYNANTQQAYYRLKQTDVNGAYSYSHIISIASTINNQGFTAWYNNAQHLLTCRGVDNNYHIHIYNSQGQHIYTTESKSKDYHTLIYMQNLPPGIYYVCNKLRAATFVVSQ